MQTIKLNRIPLMFLAEVMQKIYETPAKEMAWAKGKIISPTLPSSFLKW